MSTKVRSMVLVRSVLGTGDLGKRTSQEESEKMLKVFKSFGHNEIDTAYMYGGGLSEQAIGKFSDRDIVIATKANPWDGNSLSPGGVRKQLETSLQRLNRTSVDMFYLHAPDHNVPITDTLREVNKMFDEKKFKQLGISNYAAWQVAEIYYICEQNNWVKPTLYQGMYNIFARKVEAELFDCLRHFGIRFYAYNPLACGLLTGKHKIEDATKTEPGRFFGNNKWTALYRDRYWREEYFESVEKIKNKLNEIYGENKVSVAEAAYRWLYHHSFLKGENRDAVLIGASSSSQLKINLENSEKEALDSSIVTVINDVWRETNHLIVNYAR